MEATETQPQHMKTEPQKEHTWLQKLVGDWTYEAEAAMEPGKPAEKFTGTESVRTLGDIWFVAEGHGMMPGGDEATTILTLGYDTRKHHYVGTWIGSMMTNMWVYDGKLTANEKALELYTEGPRMTSEGATADYKEVIEFKDDDHRVFTSHMKTDDGRWEQLMTAHYRRRK
jgi:hypothetical protein